MIGKIITGKSFRGCIKYCLHDKLQKQNEEVVFKDRAFVILYNRCYGTAAELIGQFNELRRHHLRLSKPVLHITLSLPPEEYLAPHILSQMAQDCAVYFGFDQNQFVAAAHKDTRHQHLHIVANRIGFDGKTVSDSNSYKRMAQCCRMLELKYQLKEVLSPKLFLAKELRHLPRSDSRKELLKKDIHECLQTSHNYQEFEKKMQQLHYTISKSRGIAFTDLKKVYTKGSEVGYSLSTIEKVLERQRLSQPATNISYEQWKQDRLKQPQKKAQTSLFEQPVRTTILNTVQQQIGDTVGGLVKPEETQPSVDPNLLKKKQQKKKKRGLH